MKNKKESVFSFDMETKEIPKVQRASGESIYKEAIQAFLNTGKKCLRIMWNGTQKHATVVLGLRGAVRTYNFEAKVHDIKTEKGQEIYLERKEET